MRTTLFLLALGQLSLAAALAAPASLVCGSVLMLASFAPGYEDEDGDEV
jgi:hypothetical protein